MLTATKQKPCAGCGSMFQPFSSTARACSQRCAQKVVKADKQVEKEKLKARQEAVKSVTDLKAEAQKEVNAFVRIRDAHLPCISCGKPWQDTFQAGHFRSRGAASHLALDPANIAGQCVQCNLHRHGNQIGFRAGLIERYGVSHVEKLEADNEPVKLERDVLRQIKTIFKAKTRQLKKERGE